MATKRQKRKLDTKKAPVDYDSAWKDIIEGMFKHFLEFFFPYIHDDIDFDKPPEFLSQELRKIFKDGKTGKRYTDVLVKVHLKDGTVGCIFIHIEVQSDKDNSFAERMFVYNYRIYEHHRDKGEDVISLAVLTDDDEKFRPTEYRSGRWKFERRMTFPMVKILDFRDKTGELEQSPNPMAMVVLAQLESLRAKKESDDTRFDIKKNLLRRCSRKGYDRAKITGLFRFIDWVINLPAKYQNKITFEISNIMEENKMAYVATWERQWKKEGKQEGKREGKLETAKNLLKKGIPVETVIECTGLTQKDIDSLMN